MSSNIPRGVRNCNPCNIRLSDNPWIGKITPSRDDAFETFDTPVHGIRAGAKILLTYFEKQKLNTIAEIITRWAPPKENKTLAYIRAVSLEAGYAVNEQLDLGDRDVLFKLMKAIIHHEIGFVPYDDDTIMAGVEAAYA